MNVQKNGAVAVIIVNDVDNVVYPGMAGSSENITIPGVMIGLTDGNQLKQFLDQKQQVTVNMTDSNRRSSPYFLPPEGLTVISMDDPFSPTLVSHITTNFFFSHNIYVEEDRPYLYVCGMSNRLEFFFSSSDIFPQLFSKQEMLLLQGLQVWTRGEYRYCFLKKNFLLSFFL